MVITPSIDTFNQLNESLKLLPSYDGADQGFLTAFFGESMKEAVLFNPKRDIPSIVFFLYIILGNAKITKITYYI